MLKVFVPIPTDGVPSLSGESGVVPTGRDESQLIRIAVPITARCNLIEFESLNINSALVPLLLSSVVPI
jgi:hypothetical protein